MARHHQGGAAEYGPPHLTRDAYNWLENILEDIELLSVGWGTSPSFEPPDEYWVPNVERELRDLRKKYEDCDGEPCPLNSIEKRVLRDVAQALQGMEADGRDSVVGDRRKTWRGWAAKDLLAAVDAQVE